MNIFNNLLFQYYIGKLKKEIESTKKLSGKENQKYTGEEMKKEEIKKKFLNKKHIEMFLLLDITFFINYLFDTYINDFRIVLILWIIFKVINFICYIYYFLFLLCVEIFIKNEKIKIIIEKISTYLYFIVSIKILFFIYKMYFLPVG